MKKEIDRRVTVHFISLKQYALLFLVLAAFSGFHQMIYHALEQSGIVKSNTQFAINILMVYVMATAALVTVLIGIFRYLTWTRPMKKLSEAARNIARGDFSFRIAPRRTGGKKDFVDVMFDDFNTMAGELGSIETLKNDFIATVSHEIKTPLSVIQSYASALKNENLSAQERTEYTGTIIEATQKLTALVTNILRLNKLENQGITGTAAPFNLGEQLRLSALAWVELWERKNISFEEDLDEINVSYDAQMLELVWNNLISNAVKFTGNGGKITLSLKSNEGFAEVRVIDTGIGIQKISRNAYLTNSFRETVRTRAKATALALHWLKKPLIYLAEP